MENNANMTSAVTGPSTRRMSIEPSCNLNDMLEKLESTDIKEEHLVQLQKYLYKVEYGIDGDFRFIAENIYEKFTARPHLPSHNEGGTHCCRACISEGSKLRNWPDNNFKYCCGTDTDAKGNAFCACIVSPTAVCGNHCGVNFMGERVAYCLNSLPDGPRNVMYKFTEAGVGVFSMSQYPRGCLMMEYVGRVTRYNLFQPTAQNFDYAMEMEYGGVKYVIDAWKEGNVWRDT